MTLHGTTHAQRSAAVERSDTRILIVDDEDSIRRFLERLLTREGYSCTTVDSMRQGRRLLEAEHFDLLMTDLMMPEESGFTLLTYAQKMHPFMAVLVVSAVNAIEVAEPTSRQGADGYIVKPFDSATILINVAGALHRRSQMVEVQAKCTRLESGVQVLDSALDTTVASRSAELLAAMSNTANESTARRRSQLS
jgi:DNA-binding NtrC family response regulator